MKHLPPAAFLIGAIALGVIALGLLIAFRPHLTTSVSQPSGIEYQTQGVLKGTDSYNLPGSAAYPNVQAPAQRTVRTQTTTTLVCPQDAMLCPDGSYVSRIAPNCQFATCPTR